MNRQINVNQFLLKVKEKCYLNPIILKYRQDLQYLRQGNSKTENGEACMLTPEEKEQNREMQKAPA